MEYEKWLRAAPQNRGSDQYVGEWDYRRYVKGGERPMYSGSVPNFHKQEGLAEKQCAGILEEAVRRGARITVFQDEILIQDSESIDIFNELWAEATKK